MAYFYSIVGFLFFWKVLIPRKFNVLLVVIATLLLIALSGLRSETVGTDTAGYIEAYSRLQNQSVYEVFVAIFDVDNKDQFFYFVSKIINFFGLSSQEYIAFLSAIYLISFAALTKKYSEDPSFSYLFLISGGFLIFSYSGLRQAMAISVTIWAFIKFTETKNKQFYLLVLFASLFHASALVFLLTPIAKNNQFRKYEQYVFLVLIASVFIFQDFLRSFIFGFGLDRLSVYEEETKTLNASGFLMYSMMYIFCVFFRNKKDEFNNTLLSMVLFGLALQAMSVIVAEFFRLAMYFNIFYAILLPRVFLNLNLRSTRYMTIGVIYIFFMFYFFYSNSFLDFQVVDF